MILVVLFHHTFMLPFHRHKHVGSDLLLTDHISSRKPHSSACIKCFQFRIDCGFEKTIPGSTAFLILSSFACVEVQRMRLRSCQDGVYVIQVPTKRCA